MRPHMRRILLVDNDEVTKGTSRNGLQSYGYSVCTANNSVEAFAQLEHQPPILILLEIVIPGMDGIEICSRIRGDTRWRFLPVMFLTKSLDIETKISAFAVGGDDYLHKPFDIRELNLRIKAVLRRSRIANETEVKSGGESDVESQRKAALQVGTLRLDTNNATVETENGIADLTPIELKLMRFLMRHPNKLFSSEQLLEKVWEYPPRVGDTALVRWHVRNLRLKIEPTPEQPRYVISVAHHGYILRV